MRACRSSPTAAKTGSCSTLQTTVAEAFGYSSMAPDGERLPVRAIEAPAMRRYYWAAKAVTQLNQILLLNIEEKLNPSERAPQRINDRFNEIQMSI